MRRLVLALILFAIAGCATVKAAGTGVIDCGRQALQAEVAAVSPDVQAILAGGSVDWQQQLDRLKDRALDALACAVAKVGVALAEATTRPPAASAVVTPADRAGFYLLKRDLHPVNVR